MKKILPLFLLLTISLISTSCFEDNDDNPQFSSLEVKDFIWKGLNYVYLYKPDVPDLADDRFSSNEEYTEYLNGFDSPESLFYNLRYLPQEVDRFSRLFSDYYALEQLLNGTSLSDGMQYSLYYKPNSNEVFGVVKLVQHNSSASNNGLVRGMMFDKVNNISLYRNSDTDNNLDLLDATNYSISLVSYDTNGTPETTDDTITSIGETIALTKTAYDENPVYDTEIINLSNGEKLGYLMYNGFYPNFNNQLNDAFAYFQSNGVQHLAIDLRYNGGGNVQTAAYLGSMVTGQFNGQVFSKTLYSENLTGQNTEYHFTTSINGGSSINSLNLDHVYVITSGGTASASEMIINSLKEYITVTQVGTTTVGKSQVSTIIYDAPAPNFSGNEANPNHTYAMLPLIGISVNANDGQVPPTGIVPDANNELGESIVNLGVLGDPSEPLLAKVIETIENTNRMVPGYQEVISPIQINLPAKPTDYILYE